MENEDLLDSSFQGLFIVKLSRSDRLGVGGMAREGSGHPSELRQLYYEALDIQPRISAGAVTPSARFY